jgi:PAS domain S-box-containing protein
MSEKVRPAEPTDADADARLAAIVDSSFDAIISKDLNSIITTWNRAAERLFGYTAEEAIGRSILMLIPDRLQGEEEGIIARIRRGESVPAFETIRCRKDGQHIHVSLTISPIRGRGGQIIGASKIARDITETKANERRIRLLLREVNHRVKNQFAVILSIVRETVKRTSNPREFERSIRERITALASSQDLLVSSEWTGARLHDLVEQQLQPFGNDERFSISGPDLLLRPTAVQALGMAFHELGTNSAKYGAVALQGWVSVSWKISGEDAGRQLDLLWEEVAASLAGRVEGEQKSRGFGTVVLMRVTPQALNGSADLERVPGVLRWHLVAPASAVIVGNELDEE